MFEIRTDLAVEEKESFPGNGGEVTGMSLRERRKAFKSFRMHFTTPQLEASILNPNIIFLVCSFTRL